MNNPSVIPAFDFREMVQAKNGEVVTTSRKVATYFGKRHGDVLRKIEQVKADCSNEFSQRNFAFTLENKQIGNTKRNTGFYQMTERGFMFLVMGFSGEKADAIKESFIDAFEWMSNQITQTFQSKWARYNHIVGYRESRKQQVSCSARDMNVWKHEKHPLDHEIAQLERELQPSLPFASEVLS